MDYAIINWMTDHPHWLMAGMVIVGIIAIVIYKKRQRIQREESLREAWLAELPRYKKLRRFMRMQRIVANVAKHQEKENLVFHLAFAEKMMDWIKNDYLCTTNGGREYTFPDTVHSLRNAIFELVKIYGLDAAHIFQFETRNPKDDRETVRRWLLTDDQIYELVCISHADKITISSDAYVLANLVSPIADRLSAKEKCMLFMAADDINETRYISQKIGRMAIAYDEAALLLSSVKNLCAIGLMLDSPWSILRERINNLDAPLHGIVDAFNLVFDRKDGLQEILSITKEHISSADELFYLVGSIRDAAKKYRGQQHASEYQVTQDRFTNNLIAWHAHQDRSINAPKHGLDLLQFIVHSKNTGAKAAELAVVNATIPHLRSNNWKLQINAALHYECNQRIFPALVGMVTTGENRNAQNALTGQVNRFADLVVKALPVLEAAGQPVS